MDWQTPEEFPNQSNCLGVPVSQKMLSAAPKGFCADPIIYTEWEHDVVFLPRVSEQMSPFFDLEVWAGMPASSCRPVPK